MVLMGPFQLNIFYDFNLLQFIFKLRSFSHSCSPKQPLAADTFCFPT